VASAQKKGKPLHELTLAEYRACSPLFTKDILELDVRASVAARDVPGGTAPARVSAALAAARRRLRGRR
jgi:argininosuccinate lyase